MPAYMLHQFEEHVDDRFRRFVDQELGNGRPVLTRLDIFLINVPGVWGIFAGSFALSATVALGYGLIPAYSALINVFMNVAPAIKMRRYNPGLISALLLLLPTSIWAITQLSQAEGVTWPYHVLGVGLGAAIHMGIMALAAKRLRSGMPRPA
ncbi:HXXEE domain-containing protein [Devosia nitrariae]